jgi:hypothetical protein
MRFVTLALVCDASGLEETRIDEIAREHELAVVRRLHLGATNDEVAGSLDVDDEMVAFDLSNRTDFFAALLEEHLIADADLEVVCHGGCLRSESTSL